MLDKRRRVSHRSADIQHVTPPTPPKRDKGDNGGKLAQEMVRRAAKIKDRPIRKKPKEPNNKSRKKKQQGREKEGDKDTR